MIEDIKLMQLSLAKHRHGIRKQLLKDLMDKGIITRDTYSEAVCECAIQYSDEIDKIIDYTKAP